MRYRTKPCEIEAVKWDPTAKPTSYPSWLCDVIVDNPEAFKQETGEITIHTLEGDMKAQPGDYIVKGLKGELYPVKPDIFEMKYEPIHHLVMVCGVDCHPGDSVCNNYCNQAPEKGPKAPFPPAGPDA